MCGEEKKRNSGNSEELKDLNKSNLKVQVEESGTPNWKDIKGRDKSWGLSSRKKATRALALEDEKAAHETLPPLGWEQKMVQPLWRSVWLFFLQSLNTYLSSDPAIPVLGIDPREMKTYDPMKTPYVNVMGVLFIITPKWTRPKCPLTGEWISKLSIHTMEYYSATKEQVTEQRGWISGALNYVRGARLQKLQWFHLYGIWKRQNCKDRKQTRGCQGWELSAETNYRGAWETF